MSVNDPPFNTYIAYILSLIFLRNVTYELICYETLLFFENCLFTNNVILIFLMSLKGSKRFLLSIPLGQNCRMINRYHQSTKRWCLVSKN